MPTASTSSPRLSAQLLNGSGEVLAAARVPALVRCVVIAIEPPSSATSAFAAGLASPSAVTATSAPPIGRTTVCTASHNESNHGILSATNSTRYIASAAVMITGLSKTRNCSGSATRPSAFSIGMTSEPLPAGENQDAGDEREHGHERRWQPERHHAGDAVQDEPDPQHQHPRIAWQSRGHHVPPVIPFRSGLPAIRQR